MDATVEAVSTPSTKKACNAPPGVKPGQVRSRSTGKFAKRDDRPLLPADADPTDELAAMLRVLRGEGTRTPLDAAFTDFLSRDPVKFLARKRQLEGGGEDPEERVARSKIDERTLALMEELTADAEAVLREHRVRGGRCVLCGGPVDEGVEASAELPKRG